MNKKIKLTIVGLGLCLALSSCNKKVEKVKPEAKSKVESSISTENSNQDVKKYETTIYDYFDTITTFSAYCKNEEEFNY